MSILGFRRPRLAVAVGLGGLAALVVAAASAAGEARPPTEAAPSLLSEEHWQAPPMLLRPLARWWWPGGSVDPAPLRSHLEAMRAAGFGAVEVQPLLLGLGDSDLQADPRLRGVGGEPFRRAVALAAQAAAELGIAFDLTLGSGWPGGLPTAKANAERQLLMAEFDVEGPVSFEGRLPDPPDQSYRSAVEWVLDVLGPEDQEARLVAVVAGQVQGRREGLPVLGNLRELPLPGADRVLRWEAPSGDWRVFAFYENSTEHFVMGGAFPGEEADARVVDHLSVRGADALLEGYAAPVIDAIGEGRTRELFVDSFELMGELPFTAGFLDAFEEQAGYRLTPELPLVFLRGGESKYGEMMDLFGRHGGPRNLGAEIGRGARVREDYERVRAALFGDVFVERLRSWAHARGVRLRLQAHGGYSDYLDTYARADIPESEALFGGGSFDFLKLAASAAHVAGRRWASSESFITLRLFGTRLSEEEMRLLAGRAFSAGINRLAYHGVPYPYERADGVRWFPFSGGFGRILAGPLPMSSEIDDEFLARLPEFNRFVARLSLAMSQGEPDVDLAWLRADPIYPDQASFQLGRIAAHAGESEPTRAFRSLGLTHDRVSRRMLAGASVEGESVVVGRARYRALVLDPIEVAEPELAEKIAAIAEAGIPVFSLGALPQRAPGLGDAALRDRRVGAATTRASSRVTALPGPEGLAPALEGRVRPALVAPRPGERLEVSIARRRSAAGDVVLVFNESWSKQSARLRFERGGGVLRVWDPRTGDSERLSDAVVAGAEFEIPLEPVETRILTLDSPRPSGATIR